MKICLTCFELYGHIVNDGNILYQGCYCKKKPKGDWSRFDYQRMWELCYCCGREMIRRGSKWCTFYCKVCHEHICSLNKRCGMTVIPIGRHSIMHGIFINPSIQGSEKEVARFCSKMNSLGDKINRAGIWKHLIISDNMKKAWFFDGLDVDVEDYLQKVSLLPHDYLANIEHMADFVCCMEETTSSSHRGIRYLS